MAPVGPDRPRVPLKRHRTKIHKKREHSIKPGATKNEINVTPLVDVVLVLLIIFMVVTPMLHRGVHVDLPVTSNHEKKQDTGEQIVVTVALDKKSYVETDLVDDEALVSHVRKLLTKRGSEGIREVHVKADRRLDYGTVRKVLERIHDAGAPNVALGTEDLKKEAKK